MNVLTTLNRSVGWACAGIVGFIIAVGGCASGPKEIAVRDATLTRHVKDANDAFVEGRIREAETKYRQALLRAWAIDDPYEAGTAAYNLAACLTSQSELQEASDWLVDARVELCRAGASTGNTWLLSAEIATSQCRFQDAETYVAHAARTCPPCEVPDTCCLCGPAGNCQSESERNCCSVPIPILGKHVEEARADDECRDGYRARIELARARIAIKQFDLSNAQAHLTNACEWSAESCDFSLHADRHDVAAALHDAKGEFLQAGSHRDREVQLLRCIGHYRVIPDVLVDAADSYASAGRLDLAVDRLIRSARVWLARGELSEAWDRVERAGEFALACGSEAVKIRLALTASIIRDALEAERTEPTTAADAKGNLPSDESGEVASDPMPPKSPSEPDVVLSAPDDPRAFIEEVPCG